MSAREAASTIFGPKISNFLIMPENNILGALFVDPGLLITRKYFLKLAKNN